MITGGAGFIGRALLGHLSDYRITIFDNFSRGLAQDGLPKADIIKGDIRNSDALAKACADTDAVIHLAAFGSVVESMADPTINFEINARGTFNILNACREQGVQRIILASTGGALIGDAEPPVDETSLPKPISPYGASKLCGEAYGSTFAQAFSLPTVALRFANIYGPYSAHKKGVITTFFKAIMRNEPLPIVGDGSSTRDYLYVDDLCRGIKRALGADIAAGEIFHLASGTETSIHELAATICEVAGVPDHTVRFLDKRPGEVERNFATFDKARAQLGFEPRWALRDGLEKTWQWFQANRTFVLSTDESDS